MAHTYKDRNRLKARLARIRGQIDAIDRALDQEHDCGEMLQQVAAVRGAVTGLLGEILEGHVRGHIAAEGLTPEEREAAGEELVEVLRRYLR